MRIEQALVAAAAFVLVASAAARAETVEIYSAGSLRGVVGDLAKAAGPDVEIKPTFGGAGALRERIEGGDKPDLFISADMGSPRKLDAEGCTAVPVVAFARNRMCVVSRRSLGVTAANLVDRLLAEGVRVKTSTPGADPAGDYAWAIFDRVDAMRPGSGEVLRRKAQGLMQATATAASPGQSPTAALFAADQIDLTLTYCSAVGALEKELPELASLPVPPQLDPHSVFGLAVLSANPAAQRLAIYLLSEKGQALIAKNGLLPVLDAPR